MSGINTYGYSGGNPVANIDRTGQIFFVPAVYYGGAALLSAGIVYYGIKAVIRPENMSRLEERHFDRTCAKSEDPCTALKAAVMKAIDDARNKMKLMQNDRTLFKYAYSLPNPAVTGTNTTWIGHADDLNGRGNNIWAMISLGRKMGCDMSLETVAAITITTPGAPHQ